MNNIPCIYLNIVVHNGFAEQPVYSIVRLPYGVLG